MTIIKETSTKYTCHATCLTCNGPKESKNYFYLINFINKKKKID